MTDSNESAELRPGDRLILRFSDPLDDDKIARIRERTESQLPGVKVTVFDGCDQLAVYRDSAPEDFNRLLRNALRTAVNEARKSARIAGQHPSAPISLGDVIDAISADT